VALRVVKFFANHKNTIGDWDVLSLKPLLLQTICFSLWIWFLGRLAPFYHHKNLFCFDVIKWSQIWKHFELNWHRSTKGEWWKARANHKVSHIKQTPYICVIHIITLQHSQLEAHTFKHMFWGHILSKPKLEDFLPIGLYKALRWKYKNQYGNTST